MIMRILRMHTPAWAPVLSI